MTVDANDIGQGASKCERGNEIDIAENGCGAADGPGADSIVYDSDRIMFLRSFTQLQRATSEGIPAEPDGQVRVVRRLPATGLA
jgi:beta-glucosidase/6-phospho-beta-glucosidase/beta-galactosidase